MLYEKGGYYDKAAAVYIRSKNWYVTTHTGCETVSRSRLWCRDVALHVVYFTKCSLKNHIAEYFTTIKHVCIRQNVSKIVAKT